MNLGAAGNGRLTLGLRHASISNNYYETNNGYSGVSNFDGIGPRVALEGSVPLGSSKVSFDWEAGAAVLFGDTESTEYSFGTYYGNESTEVINLDLSAALSYMITPNATVSIGVKGEQFRNIDLNFGDTDEIISRGAFLKFTTKF